MVYRVKVNKEMIKWARKDAGLKISDLPGYLKDVPKWESGKERPTWNDLRKLADKYKRPPIFYLMEKPPVEKKKDLIEFRSDSKIKEYSPELRLEIRKAKYRRNIYLNINNQLGNTIQKFSNNIAKEKNPKKLGEKIRSFLNISLKEQEKWIYNENDKRKYNHSIFLYQWKEVLAECGILVFETEEVKEKEMSGVSIYYEEYPIILLNGKNTENRRIFTLMHELAHLFLGKSTICDVDKYNQKERFCNNVAAEILVPEKTLTDEDIFFKNGNIKYSQLSHLYGVSQQVIIYRLADLKKISKTDKLKLIKDIEEKNEKRKNDKKMKNKQSEGGGMSKVSKKKKYEGKPYSRFILNAYENDVISSSKFMRYLDIPVDKIDSLHEEVYG